MSNSIKKPEDLDGRTLVKLILDMAHRLVVHHTLWYTEVSHQMGVEKAHTALEQVFEKSLAVQLNRLSKVLGFEMKEGLPAVLLDMPRTSQIELLDSLATNWLANDGIWFQTVEFADGMNDAKRCNDSCWAQFSPFEARSIKKILALGEYPGLEGLKAALNFRLYGRINSQSFSEETPDSFVFQMNECRVQVARKRKGLADYPCKSVGLVEYPYFARAVDSRIVTTCIGCPPDDHPATWYCAWRFSLKADETDAVVV
ncbi:MAG: DUF6125 family protein [bacterium]